MKRSEFFKSLAALTGLALLPKALMGEEKKNMTIEMGSFEKGCETSGSGCTTKEFMDKWKLHQQYPLTENDVFRVEYKGNTEDLHIELADKIKEAKDKVIIFNDSFKGRVPKNKGFYIPGRHFYYLNFKK